MEKTGSKVPELAVCVFFLAFSLGKGLGKATFSQDQEREFLVYPTSQGKWKEARSFWAIPLSLRRKAKLVAKVRKVPSFDSVELFSGRKVKLLGIGMPDSLVLPAGFKEQARQRLEDMVDEKWVHVEAENPLELAGGGGLSGYIWIPGGRCVNEILLKEGRALLFLRRPGLKRKDSLLEAALYAQRHGSGWFGMKGHTEPVAKPWPFLKGGVLPLYYEDPNLSYDSQIEAVKRAGAERISFILRGFIERPESTEIDRFSKKTVRDTRLEKTIEKAHSLGLKTMLLPIVLIRNSGEDDWRGSIRPSSLFSWFKSYLGFMIHYVDIAEAHGVETVSAGSEFCSLEKHETEWRWILRNLRGRFAGFLTYSFNWDHADVAGFHDMLDFIGMTGYFSLTDKNDPTVEELTAKWREIKKDIRRIARKYKKPIVFTELGYPSQDGANKDPWNYYMNPDKIDLKEQADCLEAFTRVFSAPSFLMGVFFFDWFEKGGPNDSSYSPVGKPALEIIKRYFRNMPSIWRL